MFNGNIIKHNVETQTTKHLQYLIYESYILLLIKYSEMNTHGTYCKVLSTPNETCRYFVKNDLGPDLLIFIVF